MAKILIVDNNPASRDFLAGLLRKEGYTVDQAADEHAGMELFQAKKHDLLLTEIGIPGKQGLEMLRALQWDNPELRCLAFLGEYDLHAYPCLERARACGALDIFANPFDSCTVLELVKMALKT